MLHKQTRTDQQEIRPCPFCDSDLTTFTAVYLSPTWMVFVKCQTCNAQGPVSYTDHIADPQAKQRAIELWNTRDHATT